jgi:hypothetical protein
MDDVDLKQSENSWNLKIKQISSRKMFIDNLIIHELLFIHFFLALKVFQSP